MSNLYNFQHQRQLSGRNYIRTNKFYCLPALQSILPKKNVIWYFNILKK